MLKSKNTYLLSLGVNEMKDTTGTPHGLNNWQCDILAYRDLNHT